MSFPTDNPRPRPFFAPDPALGKIGRDVSAPVIEDAYVGDEMSAGAGQPEFVGLAVSEAKLKAFFLVFAAALTIVIARSAHVQIAQNARYTALAEGNRSRIVLMPAERGVMYDRNGTPLVRNVPDFSVSVTPADLPADPAERADAVRRLADIVGLDPAAIESKIDEFRTYPTSPVTVADNLTHAQAVRVEIEGSRTPGVALVTGTRREYLQTAGTTSLSHLLGYQGRITAEDLEAGKGRSYSPSDYIGKAGLERSYEEALRGVYGRRRIEVDARGRQKKVIAEEAGQAGKNLVLTVDLDLQRDVEKILKDGLRAARKTRGAAVVLDPRTGDVLAMVSHPAYDNNLFARGIGADEFRALAEDPDHPLFPRAVASEIPSGSTFKLVVGAAALTEGVATPNTTVLSNGGIRVDRWWFPDWKAGGHGPTDLAKAIAESVNTYFYYVGGGRDEFEGLGVARIVDHARRFGLGSPLGIDLPGEASGFLPSKEWKEQAKGEPWYIGDTYHLAIGQGDILVTPLQIAAMTSVFANGGTLYRPRLVGAVAANDGSRDVRAPEKAATDVEPADSIAAVRRGMRLAVTSGSARSLADAPVPVAAKTGTAQWHPTKGTHAWFTSYAPYDRPEIVVTVIVEEGGEGSAVAAPIAEAIYRRYFGGARPAAAVDTAP